MYNETATRLKEDLKQYRETLATMEKEVSRLKAVIKLLEKTVKGLEDDPTEEAPEAAPEVQEHPTLRIRRVGEE